MVNKPRHYAGLPSVKSQYLSVILILYLNSNSSRLLPCVVTVPGYDPIVQHDVYADTRPINNIHVPLAVAH